MRIDVLDSTKKKAFLKEVSYLGDFKMNELFLKTGTESVRIYSGSLSTEEVLKIWRAFPIESAGLYFGKEFVDKHGNRECRLSLDALHFLKDKITGNVIEINQEQVRKWFLGENLELDTTQKKKYEKIKGFVAVKYKNDFVGTGKLSEQGALISFLPKERRIRN